MSATERNVGGMVRLGNLLGVLSWHAVVGGVCLVRGRAGLEALTGPGLGSVVTIMLGASVLVMADLVFRPRELPAAVRLVRGAGLGFVIAATATWAWVFWGAGGLAYDVLSAQFSRGFGASIDPETGAGFAGIPWLGLTCAVALAAFCTSVERAATCGETGDLVTLTGKSRHLLSWSVVVLGLLALGGVLHLANGTRLFVG